MYIDSIYRRLTSYISNSSAGSGFLVAKKVYWYHHNNSGIANFKLTTNKFKPIQPDTTKLERMQVFIVIIIMIIAIPYDQMSKSSNLVYPLYSSFVLPL